MDEDIKKLIEENLRLTQEIHVMTKKMKSYITFQKVMSFIYFIIIVVPIVLSIIYLPPLLKNIFSQYQEVLGGGSIQGLLEGGAGNLNLNNVDVKKLPPDLQKYFK